jgi:hypothetical protein
VSPKASFEEALERRLLQHGSDACSGDASAVRETSPLYRDTLPGGPPNRPLDNYDRGAPFRAGAQFRKADLGARRVPYRRLTQPTWTPNRLAQGAAS